MERQPADEDAGGEHQERQDGAESEETVLLDLLGGVTLAVAGYLLLSDVLVDVGMYLWEQVQAWSGVLIAIGAVVGVALAFLFDTLSNTFKTDDTVESLLNVPLLSVVPLVMLTYPGLPIKNCRFWGK